MGNEPGRRSIEHVGAELRGLRRRLVGYEQPTRGEWEADLVAYDDVLVEAATMLDVPGPQRSDPVAPLSPDQRAKLEQTLASAGLDIRTTDI